MTRWRPIPAFPGYDASDAGAVRALLDDPAGVRALVKASDRVLELHASELRSKGGAT